MGVCEMCGAEASLMSAMVEGTEMRVCAKCGKFGKVLSRPQRAPQRKVAATPEVVESIVDDFAKRIRGARERSGKTQKEFAQMLNEKESVIQKLETGQLNPPIKLARKLERVLKITLVEELEDAPVKAGKKDSGPLTIGDILKVKK